MIASLNASSSSAGSGGALMILRLALSTLLSLLCRRATCSTSTTSEGPKVMASYLLAALLLEGESIRSITICSTRTGSILISSFSPALATFRPSSTSTEKSPWWTDSFYLAKYVGPSACDVVAFVLKGLTTPALDWKLILLHSC